jgi:asparagine synthetase B (glutamine-hydrolysing)
MRCDDHAMIAETPIPVPDRHRHSPLEACIAAVWGEDRSAAGLPRADGRTPRAVLEDAVLQCLRRPPCVVTFSGGRDSSAVLAVATHVARAHGLELPVPITNRFPAARRTDERDWQERVIAHLGLPEWERLSWTDELDLLGPYALRVLRRHGPLMPFNAHFLEPLLERAAGGSLLTGIGGDELFYPGDRRTVVRLLYAREHPGRHGLRRLAREAAPRAVRRRLIERERPFAFGWLLEDTRSRITREYAQAAVEWPLRWDRSLDALWRSRHVQCIHATLRAMASAHDAELSSPFIEADLLSAYARHSAPAGLPGRGSALVELVGDLLPEDVLRRATKATFDDPFWNRHARAFVDRWTGRGLDPQLVSVEALRAEWHSEQPLGNSYTLLHHAWLADNE